MVTKYESWLANLEGRGDGSIQAGVHVIKTLYNNNTEFFVNLAKGCKYVRLGPTGGEERKNEHMMTDRWGCEWHFPGGYLDGQVTGHPIDDWGKYKEYKFPKPEDFTDWPKAEDRMKKVITTGGIPSAGFEHGHYFLKLTYLRGFENAMVDFMEEPPEFVDLTEKLADYWVSVIKRYSDIGVKYFTFGDDLGFQTALPVSPVKWAKFIQPGYTRIFKACHANGGKVYLHTDGKIIDIIPNLITCGVDILNPQDSVNGIDNLVALAKGKVYLDLDVDRQNVTVFGTPAEIEKHLTECVQKLGSPTGGLSLKYGVYEGTPIENVAAVVKTMESLGGYWLKKS
ncbi:MAG: uroporphyrinogen decarboxylase family protein [Elusimicrobiota bacterium]